MDGGPCARCGQPHPKCTAHRKHRDENGNLIPCMAPRKGTANVCRMHNANASRGVAHYKAKTLRYAALPQRLLARYQEARTDPELLSLRDDIALIDSRLSELIARLDSGEASALWRSLHKAQVAFDRAQAATDLPAMHAALATIRELIAKGASEAITWDELLATQERRVRLVESEQRRLHTMHQMLSVEEALALGHALIDVIRRHEADPKVLNAVQNELIGLLSQGGGVT